MVPCFFKDSKPCPEGYKKFMRSCYHVNITRLSYEKAVNECRKERVGERGDLVSLHGPYEQGQKNLIENLIFKYLNF